MLRLGGGARGCGLLTLVEVAVRGFSFVDPSVCVCVCSGGEGEGGREGGRERE